MMQVSAGNNFMYPTQANQQSAMMTISPQYHQQQQMYANQQQQQYAIPQQQQQQQQQSYQPALSYNEEMQRAMAHYEQATDRTNASMNNYMQVQPSEPYQQQQQQPQLISASYNSLNKRGRGGDENAGGGGTQGSSSSYQIRSEVADPGETTRDTRRFLQSDVFTPELRASFMKHAYNKSFRKDSILPMSTMMPNLTRFLNEEAMQNSNREANERHQMA